jgi:hypothetical protein
MGGYACQDPSYTGVYTRLTTYLGWIATTKACTQSSTNSWLKHFIPINHLIHLISNPYPTTSVLVSRRLNLYSLKIQLALVCVICHLFVLKGKTQ